MVMCIAPACSSACTTGAHLCICRPIGELVVFIDDNGDEGVASLADGLRRGRLPSLHFLGLVDAQIGPQGATALAPALTKRALPSLERLDLNNNPLGDAGLAALLPALRQLPPLRALDLAETNIGDDGVASLVAQPTAGALKSLEELFLSLSSAATRSPTPAAPRSPPLCAVGSCWRSRGSS